MQAVTVYLGDRTLREVDQSYVVAVPAHIVNETDLERRRPMFVHFDRQEQSVVYRTREQNPTDGSAPGSEIFLGTYQLRRLEKTSLGLTIPRDVVVHTDAEIGTSLGIYWDPSDRALQYRLNTDDNPFSRLC